jgi:hypothetical protein
MTNPIGFDAVLFNQIKPQSTSIKPSNFSATPSQIDPPASTSVSLSSSQTLAQLKEKYNVTDMSNRDLAFFSQELAKNGLISEFEAASLSLVIIPPGSTYNPNARVNIFQQVQNQLEFSKQYNSAEETQSLSHVLDVLKALRR